MSYIGSSFGAVYPSEYIIEKIQAQQIEKRYFGNSVLAEVQGDYMQKYYPHNGNNVNGTTPITNSPNGNTSDGRDDGKIPFKEKIKNFGKGLIAPVKNIFSSPKNMAITAASIVAGGALIAATGGAAAPIMAGIGLAGGTYQIGKGIYRQAKATTDNEARSAWQQMGTGTFTVGVSAVGAKASAKYIKGKPVPPPTSGGKPLPLPPPSTPSSPKTSFFTSLKGIFSKGLAWATSKIHKPSGASTSAIGDTLLLNSQKPVAGYLPAGKPQYQVPHSAPLEMQPQIYQYQPSQIVQNNVPQTGNNSIMLPAKPEVLALNAPKQYNALPPVPEHLGLPTPTNHLTLPPAPKHLGLPAPIEHLALPPAPQYSALPPAPKHLAFPVNPQYKALASGF